MHDAAEFARENALHSLILALRCTRSKADENLRMRSLFFCGRGGHDAETVYGRRAAR